MRDDVSPEGVSRTQTPSNAQPGADSGEYSSKGKERSLKDMPFIDALEEVSRLAKKSHVIKHLAEVFSPIKPLNCF